MTSETRYPVAAEKPPDASPPPPTIGQQAYTQGTLPADDQAFAQAHQMSVARALKPRAYSHTTYVAGVYSSFTP